jgi:hypothetical protein
MVTEQSDSAAASARPRGFFIWPNLATDQDVDAYLKLARLAVYFAAVAIVAAGAVAIELLLREPNAAETSVAANTATLFGASAAALAAQGYLLYRRRSRILAVLLLLTGLAQVLEGAIVGGRLGIGVGAVLVIFGLGSLRATIIWHKRHPAAVRWGHVVVATVGMAATVLVTGVPVWIVVLAMSGNDRDLANDVSGNVGLLAGMAVTALLTRKFPTTAAAAAT